MNQRSVGGAWETKAAEYLRENGVEILERNFRSRYGEIDIIGRHVGYLVFVEVKYRAGFSRGYALEAVGIQKQRRICRTADYYRCKHGIGAGVGIRYDVVAFQDGQVEWICNAFPHQYWK